MNEINNTNSEVNSEIDYELIYQVFTNILLRITNQQTIEAHQKASKESTDNAIKYNNSKERNR